MLWQSFCLIYGGCMLWNRRRHLPAVCMGFLAGASVAFFCMHFLPVVFESGVFYVAVAGVLCGVAVGTVIEKHGTWYGVLAFLSAAFLWNETREAGVCLSLVQALTGGICLYLSCADVLPEECEIRESIWRGIAGLLGFWLGVWLSF